MKKRLYLLIISLVIVTLFACNSENQKKERSYKKRDNVELRDLEHIKKDGKLNVLTTYSSTSYFLYRGQPMGYEYELLKRFAKHLGIELNIVISNNIDTMYQELHLHPGYHLPGSHRYYHRRDSRHRQRV